VAVLEAQPAALALRREYNEVAARIDTLVRLYSAERLTRLTDPSITPGVILPQGMRLVLLIWADDEAKLFLNGAPVGETRLTPTRIEIPELYLQSENLLTARCWDTDRVESGFMAGLYVEDGAGLRPVLTTAEGQGWEVASGTQQGTAATEIFYAHTQPDMPGAQVMWGSQLFGNVDLQVQFSAADVSRAVRQTPETAMLTRVQDRKMEFHESIARLVGLQERRRELSTRLSAGAQRLDVHLRFHNGAFFSGLGYTLGQASPLEEETDLAIETALQSWTRQLPASHQELVLQEARALRGMAAATAAAPLREAAGKMADRHADRQADYRPPDEQGAVGVGEGGEAGESAGSGGSRGSAVTIIPSTSFLFMAGLVILLASWTGIHGWRGWLLWHAVDWVEEA